MLEVKKIPPLPDYDDGALSDYDEYFYVTRNDDHIQTTRSDAYSLVGQGLYFYNEGRTLYILSVGGQPRNDVTLSRVMSKVEYEIYTASQASHMRVAIATDERNQVLQVNVHDLYVARSLSVGTNNLVQGVMGGKRVRALSAVSQILDAVAAVMGDPCPHCGESGYMDEPENCPVCQEAGSEND